MVSIDLKYIPGDEVWIKGQYRVCYIDQVILEKGNRGKIEPTYTWYNLEYGVDCTEIWDDGYFTNDDIGKTVFDSFSEYAKAFPDDQEYY